MNERYGRKSHRAKEFDEVAGCERNRKEHKKRGTSKYRIWSIGEAEPWSKDVKQ